MTSLPTPIFSREPTTSLILQDHHKEHNEVPDKVLASPTPVKRQAPPPPPNIPSIKERVHIEVSLSSPPTPPPPFYPEAEGGSHLEAEDDLLQLEEKEENSEELRGGGSPRSPRMGTHRLKKLRLKGRDYRKGGDGLRGKNVMENARVSKSDLKRVMK